MAPKRFLHEKWQNAHFLLVKKQLFCASCREKHLCCFILYLISPIWLIYDHIPSLMLYNFMAIPFPTPPPSHALRKGKSKKTICNQDSDSSVEYLSGCIKGFVYLAKEKEDCESGKVNKKIKCKRKFLFLSFIFFF